MEQRQVSASRQLKLLELQEINGKIEEADRTLRVAAFNKGWCESRRAQILKDLEGHED